MANTKEVRKQISSIKSTRKITSALEMVAASKIKKTQDLMFGGRPYSEKVKEVIEHIASSSSEYSHPFYEERKNKSSCYIVVGSDKGLCGGLNINLFKKIIAEAAENQKNGIVLSDFESFYKKMTEDFDLNIIGLMCIPPFVDDTKKYFEKMIELKSKTNLKELSMGMSNDYIEAAKYSSTYVRIGSKIFGSRS